MVSRKCKAVFIWHFITQWILLLFVFLLFNINLCTCICRTKIGDRYKRELTTLLPELPQGDMNTDVSQLPPKSDPCYPFVNIQNNQFYSPGWPNTTYTNNTDCVLVLEAPQGHLIKLDFRDWFAIEPSPDCKNDFLEVRDGPHGYNTPLEKPFCGFEFPPMLTSTDRHLWIHFRSDENIEYQGFRAVFEFIPRPPSLKVPEIMPCRMDLVDLDAGEGIFSKNNIPQEIIDFNQQHNMPIDCIWAITVKEKWRIQLQFQKFLLEKPNDCESNFVEVFSDRTDMPSEDKNFCGSIADTVLSKHNVMFVRFFSEAADMKSYFEANFTAFRENDKSSSTYKENCDEGEFDCDDATCISMKLRCNGRYNCRFRWDEDDCQNSQSLGLNDDHIIIIMVIFTLILTGMCLTFIYNCVKKLIRDHHTIQEYVRQSREHQLNELDKHEEISKKMSIASLNKRSRSPSLQQQQQMQNSVISRLNDSTTTTPCYVPGGDILPILIRNHPPHHQISDPYNNQTIYTVDNDIINEQHEQEQQQQLPEMCDSACQTRESLFNTTTSQSSGQSSPNSYYNNTIINNSPPAPFSTFGYNKKDTNNSNNNKFKAEAKIEMMTTTSENKCMDNIKNCDGTKHNNNSSRPRPYSVQTTKSAPDVIVTH